MRNEKQVNRQSEKQGGSKGRILTIPNLLSAFRICLLPVMIWLYCVEKNYVWTMYILFLSGMTDLADGYIARKFHMISDVGKVLDPVADKLTQVTMLVCLTIRFPLMAVPLFLMAVKELFMGVAGLLVIRKTGRVFGARWHGKAATCLLYLMVLVHVAWIDIPPAASGAFIAACVFMMAVSLIFYGVDHLKVLGGKNCGKGETRDGG